MVSPTRSSRLSTRTAARTWVESVRCRPRSRIRPSSLASVQEGVQEPLFGLAVDQAGAELAEHGVIEAGIGQFQAQGVLPVDAAADGVGGLAIGEALDVLEDGGQGQPGGRSRGLAAGGEQIGELVVAVERSEFIGDAEAEGALGEGGVGDAPGLFGDRRSPAGDGVTSVTLVSKGVGMRFDSVCPRSSRNGKREAEESRG